jgi:hypothetical protein
VPRNGAVNTMASGGSPQVQGHRNISRMQSNNGMRGHGRNVSNSTIESNLSRGSPGDGRGKHLKGGPSNQSFSNGRSRQAKQSPNTPSFVVGNKPRPAMRKESLSRGKLGSFAGKHSPREPKFEGQHGLHGRNMSSAQMSSGTYVLIFI